MSTVNRIPTVLEKIVARKREEVSQRSQTKPLAEVQRQAVAEPPARGFVAAIEARVSAGGAAVIAEIKKASPSRGVIRENFFPAAIASSYERGGATCLSVLTDEDFFQGCDRYLQEARNASSLPVIRKDFIVDAYQVYEARAIGADCILLIVAILEFEQLQRLNTLALELGMDVLVEVHNAGELELALRLPNRLVGINNRDLHSFEVSLDHTFELLEYIGNDRIVVTESGIHSVDDVLALRGSNVNAFLVGEAFMRCEDPGSRLQELFS